MCGRYAIFEPPHKLKDLFCTENILNIEPRYNAAPMQMLPVIVHNRMGMARWGLLPEWAQQDDTSLSSKMINARSETVHEKPAYRNSWAKKRRCLVPVNGFYEWQKNKNSDKKDPYYIHRNDNEVALLAGLWSKTGNLVTFTILTKQADEHIAHMHARMPVIIPSSQTSAWLTSDHQKACAMIKNAHGKDLDFHQVSRDVGKVSNDREDLIQKITPPPELALEQQSA